jgi:hypothetical protein
VDQGGGQPAGDAAAKGREVGHGPDTAGASGAGETAGQIRPSASSEHEPKMRDAAHTNPDTVDPKNKVRRDRARRGQSKGR